MLARVVVYLSAVTIAGFLSGSLRTLSAQRLSEVQMIHTNAPKFRGQWVSASVFRSSPDRLTSSEERRTYWLEGGAVGGLALGALGYELGSACPKNTGSCPSSVVGFLIGATVGFVIGAFLGDTIEKNRE